MSSFKVALAQSKIIREAFIQGKLGPVEHEVYPDLERGSRDAALFFTFAPALNFQRKSEGLWRAAKRTFEDPSTRFAFDPELASRDVEGLRTALTRHGLAAQKVKQTHIWYKIATSLSRDFDGDPRNLLALNGYYVPEVVVYLTSRRADFPYLSGPKLSNYWLYILSRFTDVPLRGNELISIIPDVHVMRATARLGLAPEGFSDPHATAQIWFKLLKGSGIVPLEMHAPLWRWSRCGFPAVSSLL